MSRAAALLAVALLVPGSVAVAAEPFSQQVYPPPPADFDPRVVMASGTSGADHGIQWQWTSSLDGSGLRWRFPADESATQIDADTWLQPERDDCGDVDGGYEVFDEGRPSHLRLHGIARPPTVVGGSLFVGRTRGQYADEIGLGIWQVSPDTGRSHLRWDLRDPEFYAEIVASPDGTRIAAGPYTGQFRSDIPPRPRVLVPEGTFTLPRRMRPVAWDAAGGLLLNRKDGKFRWDPSTRRVQRLSSWRHNDSAATVLPGGRHIIVMKRRRAGVQRVRILDVVAGTSRTIRLASGSWSPWEWSTSRYLVLGSGSGAFEPDDRRSLWAVLDLEEGWVGYVVARLPWDAAADLTLERRADGTPVPPSWFDPRSVPFIGSPDGVPLDVSQGLWASALDGTGARMVAAGAVQGAVLPGRGMVWSEPSADAGTPRRLTVIIERPDGRRRVLLSDAAGRFSISPDGRTLAVWRMGRAGGRSLWRVPVDGSPAQRLRMVPSDAFDVLVNDDGSSVAWSRLRDGEVVHERWTWDTGVAPLDGQVIGYHCGEGMVIATPSGTWTAHDDGRRLTLITTTTTDEPQGQGLPVTAGRIWDVVVGPSRTMPGRPPIIRLVATRSDTDGLGHPISLGPGDWAPTTLGHSGYLVFRDAARRRFGVLDLRQGWFAEVPFQGPVG